MTDLFSRAASLRADYEVVDWTETSVGPPETWSTALRTALGTAFGTRFAVTLLWGPDYVLLYNEAYVDLVGDKHPDALGRPAREVFPEVWDVIEPLLRQVSDGGEATWTEDALLPLHRAGFLEDCWFTWSYSPILGADGEVEGVMDIAAETTSQVLARRRTAQLARLMVALRDAESLEQVLGRTVLELTAGSEDLTDVAVVPAPAPAPDLVLDETRVRVPIPTNQGGAGRHQLTGLVCPRLPLDEAYADHLRAIGAAIGSALDAVASRESERAISEALQHSLLTRPLATPGLEVAVRYQPASTQAQVGGDWYDAYPLPDGGVALMVGDVAGHDQNAAAAMGQLRNLARGVAYSAQVWLPSTVLQDLDQAMDGLGVAEVATAVLAVVEELGPDGHLVHWSSAGHPPPVVLTADGEAALLDAPPDLLLGLDPTVRRADHRVTLSPGDTLLLYTDGLVERRGEEIDQGLAWLVDRVRTCAGVAPDELCARVLQGVGAHDDDLVMLAVRARPA